MPIFDPDSTENKPKYFPIGIQKMRIKIIDVEFRLSSNDNDMNIFELKVISDNFKNNTFKLCMVITEKTGWRYAKFCKMFGVGKHEIEDAVKEFQGIKADIELKISTQKDSDYLKYEILSADVFSPAIISRNDVDDDLPF